MLMSKRCHHCEGTGGTDESPCYDCLGTGQLHCRCRRPVADIVRLRLCDIDEVCECPQDRVWRPDKI